MDGGEFAQAGRQPFAGPGQPFAGPSIVMDFIVDLIRGSSTFLTVPWSHMETCSMYFTYFFVAGFLLSLVLLLVCVPFRLTMK